MSRFRPPLSPRPVPPRPGGPAAVTTPPPARPATPLPLAPRKPLAPAPPPPAPFFTSGAQNNAVRLVGLFGLMFMIPIAELSTRFAGVYIPIFPLVELLVTIALVFSHRAGIFWQTKIAKPWMALLVLMTAAALLGIYPRVSTTFMLQYGLRFHVLPFYTCALLVTTRQVRYVMYWACAGAVILLGLCAAFLQYGDGRMFILPGSSLSNPNDLAFVLLLGFVFLSVLLFADSIVIRLLCLVALALSVYFVLKTGSRANFLALLALAPVAFLLVGKRVKAVMLVLIPLGALAVFLTVPRSTLTRLTLILANPDLGQAQDSVQASAIGSQIARTELQKRAFELSLHHPLLGVGAQQFQIAVEVMVRQESGRKSGWEEAHNTYLGLAAENGFIALGCYLASLFFCFQMNLSAYRSCRKDKRLRGALGQSLCLILLTAAYCVGIAFSNAEYDPHLDLLVGLSAANYLAMRRESQALGVSNGLGVNNAMRVSKALGVNPSPAAPPVAIPSPARS